MHKVLLTMALAMTFVTPLEAAPISVPMAAPAHADVQKVQGWDGDREWRRDRGRRDWRGDRRNARRQWREERDWRRSMRHRDCARRGNCDGYERQWNYYQSRRHNRDYRRGDGPSLEFRF
jgi:hypothetical protein